MVNNRNGQIRRIAIVGGGASGMYAAISAADELKKAGIKAEITVFEANARIGKKILVTGNGRCNMTNSDISPLYYRGSPVLFDNIYKKYGREETLEFFANAGLYTRTDFAGRIYPMSNQASSVLDTLRAELSCHDITVCTENKINTIRKKGTGFILNSEIYADKVIIAAGGKAAPVHGSDGSGLKMLKELGIKITPLYPALTAMNVQQPTKALKGIRAEGKITLKSGGKIIAQSSGEIQYTDYGLSGIPAMQISRFAASAIGEHKEVIAVVDALPAMETEHFKSTLLKIKKHDPMRTIEDVLTGFMPKKLGTYFASQVSVSPVRNIGSVFDNAIEKLVNVIKNNKYKIVSVRDFAEAQVTAGGVAESEIDIDTMELKNIKGMFVCGEIVDIDGDCGGYNLQWAFSSGAVAGISCARELIKDASHK